MAAMTPAPALPRTAGVTSAWVKSVSTIAAPNDGSTLPDVIKDHVPYIQSYIARLAREAGARNDLADMTYDFRLDQWGIAQRGTGESIWDIKRQIGIVSPELHLYFSMPLTVTQVIATGFFEVGALVALDGKWQRLDKIRILGSPIHYSATPATTSGVAPELGEHTEWVLTEICGYSREEVKRLAQEEAI